MNAVYNLQDKTTYLQLATFSLKLHELSLDPNYYIIIHSYKKFNWSYQIYFLMGLSLRTNYNNYEYIIINFVFCILWLYQSVIDSFTPSNLTVCEGSTLNTTIFIDMVSVNHGHVPLIGRLLVQEGSAMRGW